MGRSTAVRGALRAGHEYDVQARSTAPSTARANGRSPARRTVTVGAVHDAAERHADALAAQALAVSRDWAGGEATHGDRPHGAPAGPGQVHRSGTAAAAGALQVSAEALESGSPGAPLPGAVRRRMEDGFGTDLSHVRVHDGPESARLAQSLAARAFTHGSDIHFGAGELRPGTPAGDTVLAHELAHVVQGGRGSGAPVRRFPATALAGPSVWQPFTGSVVRPGEGLSGGVYILTAKDPRAPIKKVVVKPVFGANAAGTMETGEQMVFGDKALAQWFGISTPVSRSIPAGSSEFADLATLCQSKQPPKPAEGGDDWRPVSAASSLVVMSEVPEGRSISGLAEKAGGSASAANELYRTVFSDSVLADLGRLQVGDLLLGNSDRMAAGAMNLGNVMVSMSGPHPKIYAIDTNALFDRPDPKKVVADGSASSALQDSRSATTAEHLKREPGTYLDGFFEVVVERVRAGAAASTTPNAGNTLSPADLIASTYAAHRDRFVASFEYGWQDGLIQVFTLINTKEGRAQMKGLTSGVSPEARKGGLQTAGLKTNAAMLAGLAEGKTGTQASASAAQYAAMKWLKTFDRSRLLLPVDEFFWSTARFSADAATADVSDVEPPVRSGALSRAFGASGYGYADYNQQLLSTVAQGAAKLKSDGDALGSKTRGVFRRTVSPRNRTQARAFIAEAHLLAVGAARAASYGGVALDALENVQLALSGPDKQAQAAAARPVAQSANAALTAMPDTMRQYGTSLRQAAAAMPRIKKFGARADVAKVLVTLAEKAEAAGTWMTDQAKARRTKELVASLQRG